MNKRMLSKLLVAVLSLSAAAISPLSAATTDSTKYEAESATLHNVTLADNSVSGYSGTGYVAGMDASDAYIEFTVNVPTAGRYNLGICFCAPYGYKQETVTVNGGQSFNAIFEPSTEFAEVNAGVIKLQAGENKIRISRCWGWTLFDYITVSPASALEVNTNVSDKLINPNATAETQKLMTYLTSIYGKNILSGQFAYTTKYTEIDAIYKETGKYPAIIGLDFSDYSPSRVALGCNPGQDTEKAIEYWKDGGISTFCWHWASPIGGATDANKWGTFYTEHTTYDLSVAMNDHTSEEYTTLIRDIDAIAVQLKKLQDAGVPILWRPLHEASGGWFWWGAKGPEPYKELWKLMYDRLTNYHGINNLIWVWNAQDAEWYPGDEYVDIIGEDIYAAKQDYDSQANGFIKAMGYTTSTDKMITLSENGVLMDPDILVGDGVPWLWNCTWGGEFVVPWVGSTDYTEAYTSKEMLKKYYDHEYVLTRDELPEYLFDASVIVGEQTKVTVTTPEEGTVFDCSESYTPIELSATVENAEDYTVEFFVNGESVGTGETVSWTPSGKTTNADGIENYKVVAKVTTAAGRVTTSDAVNIKVKLPVKEAMTVKLTDEITDIIDATEGATVTLGAEVAHAETDYTVEFFVDGVSIGKGESVDWTINDETTNADGLKTYVVKVVATSADGEKAEAQKEVTVKLPIKEREDRDLTISQTKGSASTNSIGIGLEVTNNGEAMDLDKLEMRYYFTEADAPEQTLWCDHSAIQLNTEPWYVTLTSAVNSEVVSLGNGDYYLSIKFNDATSMTQGAKLVFQGRLTKADWTNYDQTDDFSYNNGIAVYYDGVLAAGMEP
nr:glycosyl hydrolase [uncultured Cellulosilyticum sp.]